ncbi:MAG TPA: hypothetical protein VF530_15595 [Planctomycetota bacterium]
MRVLLADRSCPVPFALLAGLLALGCESNSSSSGDEVPDPGDTTAPLAVVQFPPDRSLTDAPRVGFTVSAADPSGVAAVLVAGQSASVGPDGLWRVSVPLAPGTQTLRVETRDTLDNRNAAAAQVTVKREDALWIEPAAVAFDTLSAEALVLDASATALYGVDPFSGQRTLRSGPGLGTGPLFSQGRDVEFLATRGAALVTDGASDSIFLVQLVSGARSILSGGSIGGGPSFIDPHGIAADEVRNRALVLDAVRAELIAVDLSTGARSTLSSATLGTGPSLDGTRRIVYDPARNRALLTSALSPVILAVDLDNGNRSLFSGGGAGSGPAFVALADLVLDRFQDRLVVTDAGVPGVFEVDALGTRRLISGGGVASGPAFLAPAGVSLYLNSVPLVIDRALDALFEVAAVTGNRRILTRVNQGGGPQLAQPSAADGATGPARLELADGAQILSMALATGERTLLSGPGRGSGPPFVALADVIVSPLPGPCLTALDAGAGALLDVDLVSGDRSELSGPGRGAGPALGGALRLAARFSPVQLDGCASRVVVLDHPLGGQAALLEVELGSGDRTVLSDGTHGLGPAIVAPSALEILHGAATATVLDRARPAVFSVDLASGDRSVLADLPGLFAQASDLATFEPERILISVASPAGLHVLRLPAGTTLVLSDAGNGAGPAFGRPASVEVVASALAGGGSRPSTAHVVDQLRGAVLAVDLVTGERVIRTK